MIKAIFKRGDRAEIVHLDGNDGKLGWRVGEIVTVDEDDSSAPWCIGRIGRCVFSQDQLKPVEDRTTWHPHHDEIVAWAKGAKIEFRDLPAVSEWSEAPDPSWTGTKEYRVKPDHTAEIAEIERKMRELSESQKELADRLEKLK